MKIIKYRSLSIGVILSGVLFSFQNCQRSPQALEDIKDRDVFDQPNDFNSGKSTSTEGALATEQSRPNSGQSNGSISGGTKSATTKTQLAKTITQPASISNQSTVISQPATLANASKTSLEIRSVTPPEPAPVNCSDILKKLGWKQNDFVRVDFIPNSNMKMTASTEYTYSGFSIRFEAKASNPEFYELINNFFDSGFGIRLMDKKTGVIASVTPNDLVSLPSIVTSSQIVAGISIYNVEKFAFLGFGVNRNIYNKFKGRLSEVDVELSCNNQKVINSLQDFRSLTPKLDSEMVRISNGGYTFKPGTPSDYVYLRCKDDVAVGSAVDCIVEGSKIKKVQWYYNDQIYSDFNDQKSVKAGTLGSGFHKVQAFVGFESGITTWTQIKIIHAQ